MDDRPWRYVLAVAAEKSFSQAARKLYISQPSLSQYVKKIETEVGMELFDRSASPISLTEAGEAFVNTANKIQELERQLLQQVNDLANLQCGKLTIGSSDYNSTKFLPQILTVFREMYPDIDICMAEGSTLEIEDFVLNGVADVGLALLPLHYQQLQAEELFTEEFIIALSPRHQLSRSFSNLNLLRNPLPLIDFSQLSNTPFIIMKKGHLLRDSFFELCNKAAFTPKVVLETHSLFAAQSLVSAGMGAALLPYTIIFNNIAEPPCYFSLGSIAPARRLAVIYKKERYLSKAARAFISLLKSTLSVNYLAKYEIFNNQVKS